MIYRKKTDNWYEGEPKSLWGTFTSFVEIGDDSYALRDVQLYQNGYALRYDRENWLDGVGCLGSMKYDEQKWLELWGPDEAIEASEFEEAWASSENAPNQPQDYSHKHGPWPILDRINNE